MLHETTKIVGFFLQPSSLALLAVAFGLWISRRPSSRWGARLAWGGCFALAIMGVSPIGNALILPLEQRFPGFDAARPNGDIAGVVILGGAEDGRISAERRGLALNEAAERITEGARLARLLPAAKIVFTGGVARMLFDGPAGGEPVARFLADMGVAPERILVEDRSRDTVENAAFTRDLVNPKPGERWLLVTSAYHMPRAVGVFRAVGFDVLAYPVDFRTAGWGDLARPFASLADGLKRTDVAAKEWAGLVAYRLLKRTSELLAQ